MQTLIKGWNFPLWAPVAESGGADGAGEGLIYAGDQPAAPHALTGTDAFESDDQAGHDAAHGAAADAGWDASEDEAAQAAERDLMSPEERAAAELDDAEREVAEARLDMIPEDGVYELVMPEGVTADAEMLAAIGPEFAELGLSNRDAQRLADTFIATQTARLARQAEQWAATTQGWVDEARRDPEIGGARWDRTVATAAGVVARFGSPGLPEYLNASGAGNHPELIRLLAKVGAAIGEDNPALSETPGGGGKQDAASILYPNDPPKGK